MDEPAVRLLATLERALPALRALGDADAARRPAPGKWSPKELVGHLVDSASVNAERFVRARFADDLVLPGYDQDAWVEAQGYADAPWDELVTLFDALNRHVARIMAATPEGDRARERRAHNLDAIAFRTVPTSEPTTLSYLMADYVDHLEHHLRGLVPG